MVLFTGSNLLKIPENKFLWDKICHFRFQEPDAVITFAGKLATQNNWTEPFTKRVIGEYRKFIFLCCIAPRGVSPSKIVDEAWHLHLTYTRSYWIDLCKNTLGMDLHHNPSKGGMEEDHKYEILYRDTLRLYKEVFGEAPPEDIWPKPKQGYTEIMGPDFSPGNQKRQWIIILLSIPFVFIILNYQVVFPFYLDGPRFLLFYGLLGVTSGIAFYLALKQKARLTEAAVQDHFPEDASVFQVARFLFGKHMAIQTGIVDLVHNSLLNVNNEKKFRISSNRDYLDHAGQNPFTSSLLNEETGKELSYKEIEDRWYSEEKFSHPVLERIEELAGRKESFIRKFFIPAAVLILGVARVLQGWANDRPVGFLVAQMFVFFLAILIIHSTWSQKSTVYNKVNALYREKLMLSGEDENNMVTDFALNGRSAITMAAEGILLISIFETFTPHKNPDPGSGAGGGGGGCSGGDSGGGGSCGGGGCGGCGGD